MIELLPEDFTTLDVFPLRWRLAPERTGGLPPDTLARIHPLAPARAATVADIARAQCEHSARFALTFRCDESSDVVRSKLAALPPASSETILVSWDHATAMLTEWGVFVRQWDDFCYPSSDDVTIWPLDHGWTLCYRHYEIFQFRPRAAE